MIPLIACKIPQIDKQAGAQLGQAQYKLSLKLSLANYTKQNRSKQDSSQVQLKLQFEVTYITQELNQTLPPQTKPNQTT